MERIADLVREGKLDGISDLRDESDRTGMRAVIELKRDAQPMKVLNNLFKHSQLQSSFGVNMLALVEGGTQPRSLTLKRALQEYIAHRQEVLTRRTEFELERARRRAHILEGLKIALDQIDEVIATIRASRTTESARANLVKKFALSEAQATAILDMRLARLAGLERKKIEDELKEVRLEIRRLEALLADPKQILGVIKQDMTALKEKYGDERRTRIQDISGALTEEDLIPEVDVLVTLTTRGYVKRSGDEAFRTQRRGGRGVTGVTMREEDAVQHILSANSMDWLLVFTNRGRVYQLKVHELPDVGRTAKGVPIINLVNMQPDETVTTLLKVRDYASGLYLLFTTRLGRVKRTALDQFRQRALLGVDRYRHRSRGRAGLGAHDQRPRRRHARQPGRSGSPLPRGRSASHGPARRGSYRDSPRSGRPRHRFRDGHRREGLARRCRTGARQTDQDRRISSQKAGAVRASRP